MNYNSHELWALVLELRNRVKALEAAQQPTIKESLTVAPAGSLVERVVYAINGDSDGPLNWKPEARAAIREVAAWLREQKGDVDLFNAGLTLDKEAER